MATLKEGMEGINKASTARTTSDFASDDYIQLFRTNGNDMVADYKISKSVLMDCIQSALGNLLNGGTAQTTGITKVPSLVGNALGATTIANLASILGDGSNVVVSSDWDNVPYNGVFTATKAAHAPVSGATLTGVQLQNSTGQVNQFALRASNGEVYYRHKVLGASFSNWYRLDNFGCKTPAELASVLGAYLKINVFTITVDGTNWTEITSPNAPGIFFFWSSSSSQTLCEGVAINYGKYETIFELSSAMLYRVTTGKLSVKFANTEAISTSVQVFCISRNV